MAKQKLTIEELLDQSLVRDSVKPYEVPKNWLWTRFSNCLKLIESGKRPKGGVNGISNGIPSVGGEHLCYDGGFTFDNIKYVPNDFANAMIKGIIEKNDILIVKDGATTGKASFVDDAFPFKFAVINEHVFKCKTNKALLPKLGFFYVLSHLGQNYIQDNIRGAAQGGIITSFTDNLILPLPPLAEQQRIINCIENLFEKLDQAKGIIQDVLDSFESRKAAILHNAFSGELTRKWREENEVVFERDWKVKDLENCGKWYGGGTPSKSCPSYWINGNILWVSPKDMKSMYIEDTEDKITEIAIEESSANLIQNEAILFVVRSGILRRILPIAITTKAVAINQDMKALIPKEINVKFIYWYCISKESDIRTKCVKSGTTVESISTDLLYKYKVVLPPLAEQKEIVSILDSILENEYKAKELYDVIDKINHIKKSILARAFRGELGTNDPLEESVVGLLKEVLAQ